MQSYEEYVFTGERALFAEEDAQISQSIFEDGESPLKESRHIDISDTIFRWKYPLWYSNQIKANNITLLDTARAGIWYTNHITIKNSTIQAPKTFRKSSHILLEQVTFNQAEETLWNCSDINLKDVQITGDYVGLNSRNIKAKNLSLVGNYSFDGAKNIEISNSRIISKDAFWNAENVVVKNSTIVGQYLAWNAKYITFINCTIESNQGLCYVENLKLENCRLLHTDLAFEYSTVEADITSSIESIKNPISGYIKAPKIGEIIFDDSEIVSENTIITTGEMANAV